MNNPVKNVEKGFSSILVIGIVSAVVKAVNNALGDTIGDEAEAGIVAALSGLVFSAINWIKHRSVK